MTAIILLILGIRLAVKCDDRERAVSVRARFVSYRHRLAPVVATPHDRRCAIRCLRCGAISRAEEKAPDFFSINPGRNGRPVHRKYPSANLATFAAFAGADRKGSK